MATVKLHNTTRTHRSARCFRTQTRDESSFVAQQHMKVEEPLVDTWRLHVRLTVGDTWLSVALRQHVHSDGMQHKAELMTETRQRLFASCCAGMLMSIHNEIRASMWWCQSVCRLENDRVRLMLDLWTETAHNWHIFKCIQCRIV